MTKYKIGIWGQYGDGGKIADGQAVRTTIITKELELRYGKGQLNILNTNNWKSHPLKFLFQSIKLIAQSEKVIVAPADNGYKIFVPILVLFNIFYRRKLVHLVIGGFLPALLSSKPFYRFLENKFSAIFVQTEQIMIQLQNLGVENVYISSNPKRLNTLSPNDVYVNDNKEIRVCVFSRLNPEKGIREAVEAVAIANKYLGEICIKIDIYGIVQHGYEEWFDKILTDYSDIASYNGVVDYDKTVETLRDYFALLFPTYYYGEGFPGNVVDAYNSALPIIATDWLYNADAIVDGRNGILVPVKNPEAVAQALLKLYYNRDLHYTIALNNLKDSALYHPDTVLKSLYEYLD